MADEVALDGVHPVPRQQRKHPAGALGVSVPDAAALEVADGEWVRITTGRGSAVSVIEVRA